MATNLNKDAAYKAAKPKEKDYTISDGGGLHLLIKSSGSKLWQFVYKQYANIFLASHGISSARFFHKVFGVRG